MQGKASFRRGTGLELVPSGTRRALVLLALLAGCARAPARPADMSAAPAPSGATAGDSAAQRATGYDPSRALGPLFQAVQLARVFPDSKTFVDARPRRSPALIRADYLAARGLAGFDLRTFVSRNFEGPRPAGEGYRADTSQTMEQHVRALWPVLARPADQPDSLSSLVPLPRPYVVPGGRFREVYYWDSYFTMLGLVQSGRLDLVRDMLDNFAFLVRTAGHVPNGNRTYYLSRSQPPFLAAMVSLYAAAADTAAALRYLDALEAEHAFWMEGSTQLRAGEAHRRVVRLRSGALLNRYWDDRTDPRPESFREDQALAATLPPAERPELFRNVRAAAESGWDFSSRWLRNPSDLRTLETTRIVPIDLNSLLYHAERTIAALRRFRGRPGDPDAAAGYVRQAEVRRRALLATSYDPARGFFFDVRWPGGERIVDRPTLAAAAPLYFGLATPDQGRATAARLVREFLRPGGFVTSTVASGQQWDAPNGWAPLQWLATEGMRRYGAALWADSARARWLDLLRRTYQATGRMMEKYDVVDPSRRAGGGEYPAQDGFGWTNGVALAMLAEARRTVPAARVPAAR